MSLSHYVHLSVHESYNFILGLNIIMENFSCFFFDSNTQICQNLFLFPLLTLLNKKKVVFCFSFGKDKIIHGIKKRNIKQEMIAVFFSLGYKKMTVISTIYDYFNQ